MFLYIDPGTGSMLFTILISVLGAGIFFLRNSMTKIKFLMTGGKVGAVDKDRVPFAIFADHKRYWNIFRPICEKLEARGEEVLYLTASPDDPALEEEFEHVRTEFAGEGNKAFARMNMLKADVVLSTTPGLDVYQWKRSRDVDKYVHIPHAASDLTMYRMFGIDYYDAVMVSGEYHREQIRALETLRGLPQKDLPMIGVPYMDEMKKRLENAALPEDHKQTVLLAPSWGPSAVFSKFGGKILDALLQTKYDIIVRPHPQSFTSEKAMIDDLMKKYPNSDRLTWDSSNDNFEVLRKADILISDFSGVIYEYALVFDKPVIYADTSFDAGVYDAWWLEEEPWALRSLPKIGMELRKEDLETIGDLIETCISSPAFKQGREELRAEAWANEGEGAEKAVEYLIETRNQILAQREQEAEKQPQPKKKALQTQA